MKLKRQKHVKKALTFYREHFGLKPPYHVLVDGTFCKAALEAKINIAEQLPKYLDAEVKLKTTKCVIGECEALGTILYGSLRVLQQYHIETCDHKHRSKTSITDSATQNQDDPLALPVTCLAKLAKKQHKHKYMVATQDKNLSEKCRSKACIPVLYIAHGAIMLQKPSPITVQIVQEKVQASLAPTREEQIELEKSKSTEETETRKKKGPKGPNPLSCKPKKKKQSLQEQSRKNKTNRRKHRRYRGRKGGFIDLYGDLGCTAKG